MNFFGNELKVWAPAPIFAAVAAWLISVGLGLLWGPIAQWFFIGIEVALIGVGLVILRKG